MRNRRCRTPELSYGARFAAETDHGTVRTNSHGDGLWIGGVQRLGLCQFRARTWAWFMLHVRAVLRAE